MDVRCTHLKIASPAATSRNLRTSPADLIVTRGVNSLQESTNEYETCQTHICQITDVADRFVGYWKDLEYLLKTGAFLKIAT
eukprot:6214468-Pleurochrysis_carterae.AAC.3